MTSSLKPWPICGVLSIALTPYALLFAFIASSLVQAFFGSTPHSVARGIVGISQLCIGVGVAFGLMAFARKEKLPWLPLVGWASTAGIIALFMALDADG
jgi:mannose/fructose/N-acetylgalactosamine-specific phosphotransferase system component IIC